MQQPAHPQQQQMPLQLDGGADADAPPLQVAPEQKRQLIELMAEAIVALIQTDRGADNEQ